MLENPNELHWDDVNTDNGSNGSIIVSEYSNFEIDDFDILVDVKRVTIKRSFILEADDLVNPNLWTTDETEFSEVFPEVGALDDLKGDDRDVIEYLVKLWNEENPNRPVSRKDFEVVIGRDDVSSIYFESNHGSKLVLRPAPIDLGDIDYDELDPVYAVAFDRDYVLEDGDWDDVLKTLGTIFTY